MPSLRSMVGMAVVVDMNGLIKNVWSERYCWTAGIDGLVGKP